MKRRGFLGMLAGLVALPGVVIAALKPKAELPPIPELPGFSTVWVAPPPRWGKCGYCGQHRPLSKFHILRHANSCSNQNCIRPLGPYIGAKECGCASPHEYCEECTARIAAEFERLSHEARFTDTHAWYVKGGEHIPKFYRSRDVTRARIQGDPDFPRFHP